MDTPKSRPAMLPVLFLFLLVAPLSGQDSSEGDLPILGTDESTKTTVLGAATGGSGVSVEISVLERGRKRKLNLAAYTPDRRQGVSDDLEPDQIRRLIGLLQRGLAELKVETKGTSASPERPANIRLNPPVSSVTGLATTARPAPAPPAG